MSLTVTGPGGSNTQTRSNYVTVTTAAPVAQFTGNPTSGTFPLTVNFSNTSTGTITSYAWTFGDGGTSTLAAPSHSYAAAGIYTVSLTVTGPGGSNTQTRSNYVTVTTAAPVAQFTGSPTSGTFPLTVNFSNTSTGTITSYAWTFGDGGTSTVAAPSHSYAAAGVYTVNLTVTGPGGSNTQTRSNYVTVTTAAPVAQFTGNPISGTFPLTVNFSNTSTGTITSYAWTFGDGGTSTVAAPSHSYAAAGVYTVSLTVTGPGGSNTQTRNNYVTVTTAAPVAQFTGSPISGTFPLTVNFSNTSTGTITSYAWTFGDGGTSTVAAPSHSYAAAGVYTVRLTVTGPGGSNTQTRNNYVTVTTAAPVAQFTGNPTSGTFSADGQLQQHLDGNHHQLRLDLRRWRHQHRRRTEPQLCGRRGLHGETDGHRSGRQQYPDAQQLRDGDYRRTGGAVHRQPHLRDVPADGQLQQHLDGNHHQLRLDLRRWRHQHRRRTEPQLCGRRGLYGEPDGHRSGRQQYADAQQLRDGDYRRTGGAVHRQSRLRDVPADGELQQHLDAAPSPATPGPSAMAAPAPSPHRATAMRPPGSTR